MIATDACDRPRFGEDPLKSFISNKDHNVARILAKKNQVSAKIFQGIRMEGGAHTKFAVSR